MYACSLGMIFYKYIHTHVCDVEFAHICICLFLYICTYICICICMFLHLTQYIQIHKYVSTHTERHTRIGIRIYKCLQVHWI